MSKVGQTGRSYRGWLAAYPSIAKDIPIDESFRKKDLNSPLKEHFWQMREDGLIKSVGKEPAKGCPRHVWKLNPEAKPAIRKLKESYSGRLPCGHDGFTNLRDSPQYECTTCGERFDREDIQ